MNITNNNINHNVHYINHSNLNINKTIKTTRTKKTVVYTYTEDKRTYPKSSKTRNKIAFDKTGTDEIKPTMDKKTSNDENLKKKTQNPNSTEKNRITESINRCAKEYKHKCGRYMHYTYVIIHHT